MKKKILFILFMLFLSSHTNVYACGEIKELNTDKGTITATDSSNYLITVPEGTKEVTLTGSTDYEWVKGYEPRKMSTASKGEVKVNGTACGYGIYTYFIKFKFIPNIIAENDIPPVPEVQTPTEPTQEEDTNPDNTTDTPTNVGSYKLKSLIIEGYSIDFDPSKFEYDIDVESNVDEIEIKTELNEGENGIVIISGNAASLEEGQNEVTITVVDTESNVVIYTINVNKAEYKSSNNYLASIVVNGYTLNFDASKTTYDLSIGKENALDISVVTEHENATYEILNNQNLGNGSVITIRVTAEDGTTKEYAIHVSRSFNIMDYWIYILIALLVLLLILLLMITKQKKKKKTTAEPAAIGITETTAGVVQDISPASATVSTTNPLNQSAPAAATTATATASNAPGSLQIIEPTNVEENTEVVEEFTDVNAPSVDENESPTEVFKL